jgi:exopolysaccharide biosynthesis polyprenyl glycosylphosphotransferase
LGSEDRRSAVGGSGTSPAAIERRSDAGSIDRLVGSPAAAVAGGAHVLFPGGHVAPQPRTASPRPLERGAAAALPARRHRGWLVRRALAFADVLGILVAFLATEMSGGLARSESGIALGSEIGVCLLTLPAWIVVAKLYGLYERDEDRTDHSALDDLVAVFHMITIGVWLLFFATSLSHLADPQPARLFLFWAVAVTAVMVTRSIARGYARGHSAYKQNTIIVGAAHVGRSIAAKIARHPQYGLQVLGFVDHRRGDGPFPQDSDLDYLGAPDRLPGLISDLGVERVIIAFGDDNEDHSIDLIRELRELDVHIDIVPRFFELVGPSMRVHTVEGVPLMGLPPLHLSRSSRILKRALDLAGATVGLVLLAPLLGLIAAAIRLESGGPVLFRQRRMGCGEDEFSIFKFRTMVVDAEARKAALAHLNKHAAGDARMFKIEDDPRVTRVGRVLRRFSLDELPQLINVLNGTMSLVGPRPLILDEHRHIDRWARKRLTLKPGITGLWQVLGRDDIPFSDMVQLDYIYVTTWSLRTDLKLLFQTLPTLFRRTRAV